jgi:hypothetical protein
MKYTHARSSQVKNDFRTFISRMNIILFTKFYFDASFVRQYSTELESSSLAPKEMLVMKFVSNKPL